MRYDVNAVWDSWQQELFNGQQAFEKQALDLYKKGTKEEVVNLLTDHTLVWGERVVNKAWELGDMLWTRYDEKF